MSEFTKKQTDDISAAIKVLRDVMIADNPTELGSYAHSWHCNISMSVFDSFPKDCKMSVENQLVVSNDAASTFMKRLFDLETTNETGSK